MAAVWISAGLLVPPSGPRRHPAGGCCLQGTAIRRVSAVAPVQRDCRMGHCQLRWHVRRLVRCIGGRGGASSNAGRFCTSSRSVIQPPAAVGATSSKHATARHSRQTQQGPHLRQVIWPGPGRSGHTQLRSRVRNCCFRRWGRPIHPRNTRPSRSAAARLQRGLRSPRGVLKRVLLVKPRRGRVRAGQRSPKSDGVSSDSVCMLLAGSAGQPMELGPETHRHQPAVRPGGERRFRAAVQRAVGIERHTRLGSDGTAHSARDVVSWQSNSQGASAGDSYVVRRAQSTADQGRLTFSKLP